ncbi:ABC transporter ATP-binding protein [Bosea sp. (in: a-proteobacteria)]|uniref:ABC transporter ATP-binding protein n=1 Tax=Bosea sp. (in: a-proteobacteria) TaxID=1871050 RepID=UPI003B3AEC84
MSSKAEILIQATDLGKAYQIYSQPIDRLKQMFAGRRRRYYRDFFALTGINLTVRRGETVGILGRNGAGKSTLLQILCGTLQPSQGEVRVSGRIAALLELGTGFNPEFTGRENVFLYGTVLGLRRAEIEDRLQTILDFAEIGEFIDLPVKTYSSGMFVRLAFSVAINVDPDILIVDEALAVGDARFQHRCMTRIRQMQASGVAIIYVSHDTEGVKRLCDHVLVLHDGKVVNEGPASPMANWYLALMTTDYDLGKLKEIEAQAKARDARDQGGDERPDGTVDLDASEVVAVARRQVKPRIETDIAEFKYFRYGDGRARINNIFLSDNKGDVIDAAFVGETVSLNLEIEFLQNVPEYGIGLYIRDTLGTNVIGLNTFQEQFEPGPGIDGRRILFRLRLSLDIKPGFYSVSPAIAYDQFRAEWLDYIDNALIFRVVDREPNRLIFGLYYPPIRIFSEVEIDVSARE